MQKINVFWFRRDLRIHDNAGLYFALKSGLPVLPIFIFDTGILNKLPSEHDARVTFIFKEIKKLKENLEEKGSSLAVFYGQPEVVFQKLIRDFAVQAVFANHDYEPYSRERDDKISQILNVENVRFQTFKDHVIFEKGEICKADGLPYAVFTPYSRKWLQKFSSESTAPFPSEKLVPNFLKCPPFLLPNLKNLGFTETILPIPSAKIDREILKEYGLNRDFPGINGTSKLGIHLRFGTISIREVAEEALQLSPAFLNELIWRDFYAAILWFFPNVEKAPFKEKYKFIRWRNNEAEFKKWCDGQTGYPLVDAGMRELNSTGYMHNRVRMVTASFLTKHLLIDWRWGETYFAGKLLDFELASNNGGWQWAAGSGCDAAPYFRVFSPEAQQKKFDPGFAYIKKWVPEWNTRNYPPPIVENQFARERVLIAYKKVLFPG